MPLHPRLVALGFTVDGQILKAEKVSLCSAKLIGGDRALITLAPGDTIPVEGVNGLYLLKVTVGSAFIEELIQGRISSPSKVPPAPSATGIRPNDRPSVFSRSSPRPNPSTPVFVDAPAPGRHPFRDAPQTIRVPLTFAGEFERLLKPYGFTMEGQALKVPVLDGIQIVFRDDGVEIVLPDGVKFWILGANLEVGQMNVGAGQVGITL